MPAIGELLAADDGNAELVVNENSALLTAAFPQHFAELQDAVNKFVLKRGLNLFTAVMSTLALGK